MSEVTCYINYRLSAKLKDFKRYMSAESLDQLYPKHIQASEIGQLKQYNQSI